MTFEELSFHINPSTRIGSPYLQVKWQKVGQPILQAEACFVSPNQTAYTVCKTATAICYTDSDTLYICYSDATDFERVHFQQWLRRQIKQFILAMAECHLPLRFHQIESHKGFESEWSVCPQTENERPRAMRQQKSYNPVTHTCTDAATNVRLCHDARNGTHKAQAPSAEFLEIPQRAIGRKCHG